MLVEHSMDYILEHFSDIYQQEEFLSLSVEELTEILASDHLNVPKEDMVFEAAMLWLDTCPTRRQNFEKVLEQIRLPLISPSYRHTVIESLDVVKEYQGCQRFISEAKDQPFCKTARPRRTTVIGGVAKGEIFEKIESFDPLTNRWKTLGRLPFETEGRLPEDPATFKSGCTLYLTGGPGYSVNKEMFCYDVSKNSWRSAPLAPMNEPHGTFSMVMLDGYGYAFGAGLHSVEKYDPSGDTWQLVDSVELGALSDSIDDSASVGALEGHLYFIERRIWHSAVVVDGGKDGDNRLVQKIERYCEETDTWETVGQMPNVRHGFCCMSFKLRKDCAAIVDEYDSDYDDYEY